jgi:hypothetical protein
MEAISSSETSVLTRAKRRHILQDGILHMGTRYGNQCPNVQQLASRAVTCAVRLFVSSLQTVSHCAGLQQLHNDYVFLIGNVAAGSVPEELKGHRAVCHTGASFRPKPCPNYLRDAVPTTAR